MNQVRICFVGDSFVNGAGDAECLGWAGRICIDANRKGYDITYYNLGVRRETSAELKNRWLREVSDRLPKEYDGKIVFSFGTNDTTIEKGKIRIEVKDSIANAHTILSNAKKLYPILMIGPPPIADEKQNRRITNLSKQFALLCKELDVPYLNIFPLLKSNIWMDEVRKYDGAHPRTTGYTKFAEIMQNWKPWLSWFPPTKV